MLFSYNLEGFFVREWLAGQRVSIFSRRSCYRTSQIHRPIALSRPGHNSRPCSILHLSIGAHSRVIAFHDFRMQIPRVIPWVLREPKLGLQSLGTSGLFKFDDLFTWGETGPLAQNVIDIVVFNFKKLG